MKVTEKLKNQSPFSCEDIMKIYDDQGSVTLYGTDGRLKENWKKSEIEWINVDFLIPKSELPQATRFFQKSPLSVFKPRVARPSTRYPPDALP